MQEFVPKNRPDQGSASNSVTFIIENTVENNLNRK